MRRLRLLLWRRRQRRSEVLSRNALLLIDFEGSLSWYEAMDLDRSRLGGANICRAHE